MPSEEMSSGRPLEWPAPIGRVTARSRTRVWRRVWARRFGALLLAVAVVLLAATAYRITTRKYYLFLNDYMRRARQLTPAVTGSPTHVFFLLTDHFEPDWDADRVENWAERSNRRHALATLTGSDEDDMNAEVSSSGRVRVRWLSAAATYTLWIPPDADGRYVLARNLRPGGPEVAVRLAVGRTVTGRITDAARFERLDVHANGPGWTLNGTIKDGTFTLVGVPEATGTITAQGNVGGDGWIGTAPIKPDASPTIALKREGPHAFREPGSESLPEDGLTK